MKLYADTPARRTRQVVADLLVVAWLVGWVWVAGVVHDGTLALAAPGRQVESSATTMADGLSEAGDFLDGVPVVGGGASAPFEKAAEASHSLADSGRAQVRAVERLAFWLGFVVAAIPILVVLAFALPLRIRFVREATAGARFIDAAEDLDLFALRALTRQPMHVLARVSDDPAGAWRRRDTAVVHALADLELRESGLRAPRRLLAEGDPG
ncbi:MAG: hypothetical protein U0R80_20350 [Nocardioidaceae bacterium]